MSARPSIQGPGGGLEAEPFPRTQTVTRDTCHPRCAPGLRGSGPGARPAEGPPDGAAGRSRPDPSRPNSALPSRPRGTAPSRVLGHNVVAIGEPSCRYATPDLELAATRAPLTESALAVMQLCPCGNRGKVGKRKTTDPLVTAPGDVAFFGGVGHPRLQSRDSLRRNPAFSRLSPGLFQHSIGPGT